MAARPADAGAMAGRGTGPRRGVEPRPCLAHGEQSLVPTLVARAGAARRVWGDVPGPGTGDPLRAGSLRAPPEPSRPRIRLSRGDRRRRSCAHQYGELSVAKPAGCHDGASGRRGSSRRPTGARGRYASPPRPGPTYCSGSVLRVGEGPVRAPGAVGTRAAARRAMGQWRKRRGRAEGCAGRADDEAERPLSTGIPAEA